MNKKQVILTGRLAAPLCEGSRAWIRHHSGLVYHVSLETYPFVMELPEAMCA